MNIKGKVVQISLLAIVVIVLVGAMSLVLPPAVDWHSVFRPAARRLLSGQSPYEVEGFFNAPWALLPLIPLALVPENIGRAMLALLNLVIFGHVARRMGAKLLAISFLLVSPPVLHGILNGNLDWLVALGFVLPPQIGLFFIIIKPQVGIGVGLYWLVEAWRAGGWQRVLRTFRPV